MAQPAHGHLRQERHPHHPPDEEEDDDDPSFMSLEEPGPVVHKAFNPTTRKVACPQHADVIVRRRKLRTGTQAIPCWRCLGEAALRAEEGQKAAEARVDYLHKAFQAEKERSVVLSRRAATLEEEQEGLRSQIAKLVEQVAGLSEELSNVLDINKRLEMRTTPSPVSNPAAAVVVGVGGDVASSSSSSAFSPVPPDVTVKAQGGEAGPPHAALQPRPPSSPLGKAEQQLITANIAAAAAAAAAAATNVFRPHPLDMKAPPTTTTGGVPPPDTPLAQALGNGLLRMSSSQTLGSSPRRTATQTPEPEKKHWSLFGSGGKKGMKRKASTSAAAGRAAPLVSSSTSSVPMSPSTDELDEPLSVDLQAKRMLRMIDSRPELLEKIYRKSEMLEEWRLEVQLDMTSLGLVDTSREQSSQASSPPSSPSASSTIFRMEHSPSTIFEDQMELVGALTNYLKITVMKNVADCFHLAKANPDILRQTLNVVRLHEGFQQRKLAGAKEKVARTGEQDLDTILRLCAIEDWDSEVRLTLKEAAALRALEVFSIAHIEAAGLGDQPGAVGLSREGAMIGAAESLLDDLKVVLKDVPPFFAPEHRASATILGQYDAHIARQVAVLHEHGLNDMEIGDLFEINRFLHLYQREIVALGAAHPRLEMEAAAKACLQECLVKTRQQMADWYTAILGRQSEVLYDGEGKPFTANPEDLFQIIHTQVRVAMDAGGFEDDDLCTLIMVILNALKEFVAEHYNSLHGQCRLDEPKQGVSALCAVVNDYDRLYDKAGELRDELLGKGKLSHERHFALVDNVMDQFSDEQVRVSFEATRLIAFQVLRDATGSLLKSSPFDTVDGTPVAGGAGSGMPSWVGGDGGYLFGAGAGGNGTAGNVVSAAAAAAAAASNATITLSAKKKKREEALLAMVDVLKDARLTIKDYFTDLEVWLPAYFFAQVVRACYESLVNLYLVSVLRGRTCFDDVQRVHHRMKQDKQTLLDDFAGVDGHKQALEEAGLADPELVFGAWDAVTKVILMGGALHTSWTGHMLMALPPPWNVDAVLQVRALRGENLGDKRVRLETRQKLSDWYRAELQPQVQGAALAGSKKEEEDQDVKQEAAVVGRELAWRLKTSPMEVKKERMVDCVKETVYNA